MPVLPTTIRANLPSLLHFPRPIQNTGRNRVLLPSSSTFAPCIGTNPRSTHPSSCHSSSLSQHDSLTSSKMLYRRFRLIRNRFIFRFSIHSPGALSGTSCTPSRRIPVLPLEVQPHRVVGRKREVFMQTGFLWHKTSTRHAPPFQT